MLLQLPRPGHLEEDFFYDGWGFLVRSCVCYLCRGSFLSKFSLSRKRVVISIEASSSPLIERWKGLSCEKWHIDESEVVQVLKRILPGAADVAEVLGQALSIESCLMELELTDSEATLLGWRPELLDD